MTLPIIVMSFNRPKYLEEVLRSIKAQKGVSVSDDRFHLFQDGSASERSGKRYADEADIDASCDLFLQYFPNGRVHRAEFNLGVALNFDRAERFVFDTLGAEAAIFLEDDLVLGPYYLRTMERLWDLAAARDDIGYFSAFGMHKASLDQQRKFADRIEPDMQNWAFGLTRKQWLKSAPYVDQYLDLVRGVDYRDRPHDKIAALYARWGVPVKTSSQDTAKSIACHLTGSVKIKTYPVFGQYIGREGLHATPRLYEASGFHLTQVMEDDIFDKAEISDAEVDHIRSRTQDFFAREARPKPTPPGPVFKRLVEELASGNPYKGYRSTRSDADLHGWNGDHGALTRLATETKAKVIVDVGAWFGQSTATLARAQAVAAPDGTVIAVDTFLGSPEHWMMNREDVHAALNFHQGRPSFYETFLSNMTNLGLSGRVFPLAQTAQNAAWLMRRLNITPQLVHLDASHDYRQVRVEMETYWDILEPGGILMGDDFQFPNVSRAVVHFSDAIGQPYAVNFPKWWIKKPAS